MEKETFEREGEISLKIKGGHSSEKFFPSKVDKNCVLTKISEPL